jgi:biotin carboxyl carrier protein
MTGESMNVEIPLESEYGGVVSAILVRPGNAVAEGQVAMNLTE